MSKVTNAGIAIFLSIGIVYNGNAVVLRNGKDVPQAAVDKVSQVINELKQDNTFESKEGNYPILPKILTEGLYLLGQRCQNGCQMDYREFNELLHNNLYVRANYTTFRYPDLELVDEEKKEIADEKIAYLYQKLCEHEVIEKNIKGAQGSISQDMGAVLHASILGGLDQHFEGAASRGYRYVNPIKPISKNLFGLYKRSKK